ncbi:protealysin inhibitor emfourin [Actinomadura macra]|uniref:protealysin inhibitor emfourin n=1 Tax=Actinomadura macra TaxID=46164 RepID=UPI00082A87A2|nr:protealysin inhibitor emfourin [Actinomadura macra]
MRVTVESTGGFAGRDVVIAHYDTADLPPGQAERVQDAVEALAAGTRDDVAEIGADLPSYRVTVTDTEPGAEAGTEPGTEAGTEGGVHSEAERGAAVARRVFEVRGDPTSDPLIALLTAT